MEVKAQQQQQQQQNLLLEMNDPSMFYNDDQFPQIPDFPCMSSSSSSSSNPAPVKPISSATTVSSASSVSSSSTSSAVLKAEYVTTDGEDPLEEVRVPVTSSTEEAGGGSGTIDCMDLMENLGYIDLIDGNELWDPSSIFEQNPPDLQESEMVQESEMKDGDGGGRLDDLGVMFFEWLKSNKELIISAEDMRNIKLKKSTVECASKRLGSSKEGKKQLLKLILEWVQHHQLQRKNSCGGGGGEPFEFEPAPPPFNCNSWVPPTEWMPPPFTNYMYMGGDYSSGLNCQVNRVLESAPSWNPSQITMAASSYSNQFHDVGSYAPQIMPLAPCYADQYPYNPSVYPAGGADEHRFMRLGPSATKEARKKRMARQRRTCFHHHHHARQSQNSHHNHVSNTDHHSHPMMFVDDSSVSGKSQNGNWLFWASPPSPTTAPPPPVEVPHPPSSRPVQSAGDHQSNQTSPDKHQELKTEKNLKFLLQKVLKQSDVGSLGRIVLPKKEAESHLPDLDSRDGITIAMEDIGTSQVWNMRYRFWPNNKSRMYLLENTGDFVKANGLQEGDFIVIYSDVKCGKYLIRGVKVRQPATGKSESKKPVKRSYRSISQSARSSPASSPPKIAVI